MKLVIIEPLGVEKDKLLSIAQNALKDSVEIVYYDTKTTDTQELIERGKDAEIIVVANNPLNAEVINGCKNLKLLSIFLNYNFSLTFKLLKFSLFFFYFSSNFGKLFKFTVCNVCNCCTANCRSNSIRSF